MYCEWCYFCVFFILFYVFLFLSNHLIITYDVIICTGYTKFANILNLWVYIFRNDSKNKCLVKVKELLYVYLDKKNQPIESYPCMLHTFLAWYMSLPKIIKLSQTVCELRPAKNFGIRGDKYVMEKMGVFLNTTCLLVYLCLYQILSKYFKPHTQEFSLEIQSGEVTRKQPQQRLSCMWHTYCLLPMPLPNIIKISLRISKLWNAQNFGYRGDNHVTKKKVRVVSLAAVISTGPPLHLYQILSY